MAQFLYTIMSSNYLYYFAMLINILMYVNSCNIALHLYTILIKFIYDINILKSL